MQQYAAPYFLRLVVSRIGKGELLLDDPASVPMGLYEELDKLWLSLSCEFDLMAHRMLGVLPLLPEVLPHGLLYLLSALVMEDEEEIARQIIFECPEFSWM